MSNLSAGISLLAYAPFVASQSALIIGATGQTGRHLLKTLLASPHFTHVSEYGRRVTPKDEITTGIDKLEQKVIDFEKLQDSGLSQGKWDVVFITYVSRPLLIASGLTLFTD